MSGRTTVAGDWISLAEAHKLLLAQEGGDLVLVERLLVPALWEGRVRAIGRKAFVDGSLHADLTIPNKNDWLGWPDESNLTLDWSNSRAISPQGFNKRRQGGPSIRFQRTEYFRVELLISDLIKEWPELAHLIYDEHHASGNERIIKYSSRQPLTAQKLACRTAFAALYNRNIPGREAMPDKVLIGSVRDYLGRAGLVMASPDTILREAGRKER